MQSLLISLIVGASLIATPVTAVTKSSGCGKSLSSGIKTGGTGSSNRLSLKSNGTKRTYLLHLPIAYSATRPHGLIFSFHGRADTAANQERLSKFSNSDVNPHMLAVYPEGVDREWQGDPDASTDDVKFTLDMLEEISKDYCLDMERIYASGKSNGGGFAANILACDPVASTKIAAFAGFAGAYYQKVSGKCDADTVPIKCNPSRKPVPIFEMHGSADDVIAYNGGSRRGQCLPSIPHFMTEWASRNGLGTTNKSTTLEDGEAVRYEWGQGDLKGVNTHYWVEDLEHVWPDTKPNVDGCCSVLAGSRLAMEFFEKWTLSSAEDSTKETATASKSSASTISPSTAETKTAHPSVTTKTTSSASSASSTYPSPNCPGANGTTWTTTENNDFRIFCGYDTTASYFGKPIYNLRNFGKCIAACEEDEECGHVVYNGVCYLKKSVKGLKKKKKKKKGSSTNRVAIKQH